MHMHIKLLVGNKELGVTLDFQNGDVKAHVEIQSDTEFFVTYQ
jgi:hypothetical protein